MEAKDEDPALQHAREILDEILREAREIIDRIDRVLARTARDQDEVNGA